MDSVDSENSEDLEYFDESEESEDEEESSSELYIACHTAHRQSTLTTCAMIIASSVLLAARPSSLRRACSFKR